MTRRQLAAATLVCAIGIAAIARGAAPRKYTIDASRSSATIAVGKSGALSFAAGHTHEVVAPEIAGTMTFDADDPARSTVHVTIDASALKVTGKGESARDVPKVQQTMAGADVLDVRRYPTITFASTSVAITGRTGAALDAMVTGNLTLHDLTRTITVPVSVQLGAAAVTATGRFPVKQTDYGIKPVSVGGVVSVKDTVNISFTIVAR
jgi:polyisoprenoid-binding protein YceI